MTQLAHLEEPARSVVAPPLVDAAALKAWLDELPRLLRNSRTHGTWRAYASDAAHFASWCDERGVSPLPAAPADVIAYLDDHLDKLSLSTLRRRIAAISVVHDLAGLDSPTKTSAVRSAWSGVRRTLGPATTPRQVTALITDTLASVVEPLGSTRIDVRDRAMLVIGFAGALRRSELASLDVEDVSETAEGLRMVVRVSKTDQEGDGRVIGLPYGSRLGTCPVRSWRAWLEVSGLDAGAAFRSMRKGGKSMKATRINGHGVGEMIKRRVAAVGLEPDAFAGHSLRRGFITAAAHARVPERDIMRQSGHTSVASLRTYIAEAELFDDNPAAKVGL